MCKPYFQDSRHCTPYPEVLNIGFLDKFVPRCSKHLVEGFFLPLHIPSLRHHTDLESHCPIGEGKIIQDGRFQDIGVWLAGLLHEDRKGGRHSRKKKRLGGQKGVLLSFKSDWNWGIIWDLFLKTCHMSLIFCYTRLLSAVLEPGPWNLHHLLENKDSARRTIEVLSNKKHLTNLRFKSSRKIATHPNTHTCYPFFVSNPSKLKLVLISMIHSEWFGMYAYTTSHPSTIHPNGPPC